ncbi:membrane associated protein [Lachnospiraceae bacterium KM106-2]|nr:membrane associated protein [Lachnospiraceae bacterium KM106-2]
MSKKITIMVIVLIIWLGTSIISIRYPFEKKRKTQEIQYTNLMDESSRNEVKQLLLANQLKEDTVNTFLEWVTDYNARVKTVRLLKEGYRTLDQGEQVDYSEVNLEARYLKSGVMQMDPNGRLASFLLFHNFVETSKRNEASDHYLKFDLAGMKEDPLYQSIQPLINCFTVLMNPIKVSKEDTMQQHIDKIQNEWKRREIKFEKNTSVKLISVFLHDPFEQKRVVGHGGILVEGKDQLYFLEKYNSGYPYQLTIFPEEEHLVSYLLARKDIYNDEKELSPIIMKNDSVLKNKSDK